MSTIDPEILALLERIPGFDAAAQAELLPGGSSNLACRIVVDGEPAVARIGQQTPERLRSEWSIQTRAALLGLAPEVLYCDADDGILVSRFVKGDALDPSALREPNLLRAVGALLSGVHSLSSPAPALDIRGYAERYAESCPGRASTAVYTGLCEFHRTAPGSDFVLSHNDPVAENFIVGESLLLIDWEFAASNDPYFDLAVVSAHHNLGAEETCLLLEAYQGRCNQDDLQRLTHWQQIYLRLYWLWAAARGDSDTAERLTTSFVTP